MPKSSAVTLPQAAVEHMSPVARGHLPEHLQANFLVGADFEGATLRYSFVAGHIASTPRDLTVGAGIEVPNFPAVVPYSDLGYLDISNNSVLIHFDIEASFPTDGFYGPILSDPYHVVPEITHVTLIDNGGGLPRGMLK